MEILIKEYLDCEYHIFNLEDPEKSIDTTDSSVIKTTTRSSKQLLGVAKQFGSIGKSVSKLWSMTKRPKSPVEAGGTVGECFLCVKMKINRHQYVDQMLQNYLECAHARYCYHSGIFNFVDDKMIFDFLFATVTVLKFLIIIYLCD